MSVIAYCFRRLKTENKNQFAGSNDHPHTQDADAVWAGVAGHHGDGQ
jgi:hypothetical protein